MDLQPLPLPRPTDRDGFEIAIICALPLEADAVEALFDRHWDDNGGPFGKVPGDPNAYSTGAIGRHNVVLAYMPGMGKINSAIVAHYCHLTFPNVRLGLVVGIAGIVPFGPDNEEIILGDVVISDGIIQYDFGRRLPDRFVRKDTLLDSHGRPNAEIRAHLAKSKSLRGRKFLLDNMVEYLTTLRLDPQLSAKYLGAENDELFDAKYHHIGGEVPCDQSGCSGKLIPRNRLQGASNLPPAIHFGLIACGDSVMKSGEDRDSVATAEGVMAFEMESAGVWDIFPCVVIKGGCDYADSHKNKMWQRYAAATAASCMKAFLKTWMPRATKQLVEPKVPTLWDLLDTSVGRNERFRPKLTGIEVPRDSVSIAQTSKSIDHSKNPDHNRSISKPAIAIMTDIYRLAEKGPLTEEDLQCPAAPDFDLVNPNTQLTQHDENLIKFLRNNNPERHNKQIYHDLEPEAHSWIFSNEQYKNWDKNGKLLWINDEQGMAKTKLLATIKKLKLKDPKDPKDFVTYFFCQPDSNPSVEANAVLGGLIYHLACLPKLGKYLEARDENGVEDRTTVSSLSKLLRRMLEGSSETRFYLIIDAVNNCKTGAVDDLLKEINDIASACDNVRWLVSSHTNNEVSGFGKLLKLSRTASLEAVGEYVTHRLSHVKWLREDGKLSGKIRRAIQRKSDGNFRWASLACGQLEVEDSSTVASMLEDAPHELSTMEWRSQLCKHLKDGFNKREDVWGKGANVSRVLQAAIRQYNYAINIANSNDYKRGILMANIALADGYFMLSYKGPEDKRIENLEEAEARLAYALELAKELKDKPRKERVKCDQAVLNAWKVIIEVKKLEGDQTELGKSLFIAQKELIDWKDCEFDVQKVDHLLEELNKSVWELLRKILWP